MTLAVAADVGILRCRDGGLRFLGPIVGLRDVFTHDIVLDVEQIRRWAPALGRHVTYAAIPGALHDVVLSRQPARDQAYDEIERWRTAYVDAPAG